MTAVSETLRRPSANRSLPVTIIVALVVPFIGVLAAIPEFVRGRPSWGVALLVASIVGTVAWYVVLT